MRFHLRSGKRLVLAAVMASLCLTAAIAIAILLFGQFGETQGKILGSTLSVGGYGLLAVPAAVLVDQGRYRPLAFANATLAAASLALVLGAIWAEGDPPVALVKLTFSASACALAAGQIAALAARRLPADPPSVRRAFAGSNVVVLTLAAMVVVAIWVDIDSERTLPILYYRTLGALGVLDVLLVALQPILAKMHSGEGTTNHLSLLVEPGGLVELTVPGDDFSRAVARAIRQVERGGGRVVRIDRIDPPAPSAAGEALQSAQQPRTANEPEA